MDTLLFEKQIAADTKALAALACSDPPPLGIIGAKAAELLTIVRELAEYYRTALSAQSAALAAWLAKRTEPPMADMTAAPLVLYGAATENDVLACWREQLRNTTAAAAGIAVHDAEAERDWLYWHDRGEGRAAGQPFFRAEQIRDCLRETLKLVSLLTLPQETWDPREIWRMEPGTMLFSDNFAKLERDWRVFGGAKVSVSGGRMRVNGMGVTVWFKRGFSDARVAFDYCPERASGASAGALFAFCGSPVPGNDLSVSAGEMSNYNAGINTYHVSLYRGNSGMTNLRRTGSGLKMLSSVKPDACAKLGAHYRVELVKCDASVQVFVDGKLIHAYVDAGCYGPVLTRGRFGLRHFSGDGEFETSYGDFEIAALKLRSRNRIVQRPLPPR